MGTYIKDDPSAFRYKMTTTCLVCCVMSSEIPCPRVSSIEHHCGDGQPVVEDARRASDQGVAIALAGWKGGQLDGTRQHALV